MATHARGTTPGPDRSSELETGRRAPTVSVVLPTYNRRSLLGEAIESVVAQSFPDWELIVADDGSTDDTVAYLRGLRDPRIRPLFLVHGGSPARARTDALKIARGEWVAFLDSDDLWLPNKLAVQLEHLATRPEYRWSYTAYNLTDLDGTTIPSRPPTAQRSASGWILTPLLTFEVSASITTLLVRRSLLDEVGGFDEAIGLRDDYDLTLRLAARSEAWAIPQSLTIVREHADRTTRLRRPAELFRDNERVFRKTAQGAASEAIRGLCIRQCAIQLASMASALSREGRHSAALEALSRAFRDTPLAAPVWRAAADCTLRALQLKA